MLSSNQTSSSQVDSPSRILGIDPGTLYMGYAVLEVVEKAGRAGLGPTPAIVDFGVCDVHRLEDQYARLQREFFFLCELIDRLHPTCLAIETQFVDKNPQTMIKIVHAQGVAIAAALSRDLPVYEYSPMKIKMAITGNGHTTKEGVAAMLQRLFRLTDEQMPRKLDATDALAIAYCHYLQRRTPVSSASGARDWTTYAHQRGMGKDTTTPNQKLLAALAQSKKK